MLRVRVSTLESFRKLCDEEFGGMSEPELVEYIKAGQTGPGSWQMDAGTEWHRLLAGGTMNGSPFRFQPDDVIEARRLTGPGVMEVEVSGSVGPLWVVGHLDHFHGNVVTDHKLTFSPPDPERYEPSLQWRLYLLLSETETFRYLIWEFKDKDVDAEGGLCALRAWLPMNFWTYDRLKADCEEWAHRFEEWAFHNNLTRYMQTLPSETGVMG